MKKQSIALLKRLFFSVISLSIILFCWNKISFSEKLEILSLDFRQTHFNNKLDFNEQVVFIDIDERSLKFLEPDLGRWPWPRSAYKELIEFIMMGEPKSILFDILFTEGQLENRHDEYLAEVTKNSKIVSHALQFEFESNQKDVETVALPLDFSQKYPIIWKFNQKPPNHFFDFNFHDYSKPFDLLYESTPYIHVVNTFPDSDGVFRKIPLLYHYNNVWLSSLTQQAIFSLLNKPSVEFIENTNFLTADYQLNIYDNTELKYRIPITKSGELELHYYGFSKKPRIIPFADVFSYAKKLLAGDINNINDLEISPFKEFKDKIIIVGGSATGLADLKTVPTESKYPGPLIHATAISNILQNNFLSKPPYAIEVILTLLIIFMIYSIVFFGGRFIVKSFLPLLVLSIHILLSFWLFHNQNYHWPMVTPFLFGILAYGDAIVFLTMTERNKRKKISNTLSKYLSPEMTNYLIDSGINPTAEVGKKEELSILFADIQGFTSLSESISPEVLVGLLNEYLAKMTSLIFINKGTLDKFIGDAVMAFWGAPGPCEEHATLAVKTAMEMIQALKSINESWLKSGFKPIRIGIGINTGKVIVGNIGSEMRLDYTVIGDNVNLASRIEGLTRYYRVPILIGPVTYEMVKDRYLCRPVDYVIAKGKTEPVLIYQPLLDRSEATKNDKDLVEIFAAALNLYRKGHFSEAFSLFSDINEDELSVVFKMRCEELIKNPPLNWDGIFVAEVK